jgi:hypothetical protein
VIKPRLSTTALTAQDIRALMRTDQRTAIESPNGQLVFFEQFSKAECGISLNTKALAKLFELARSRMTAICAKAQRKERPPRRPRALSDEQESEPCQIIRDKSVTGSYVTKWELINYIEVDFRANLTYGWIHCFLQRRDDEVREAVVAPAELPRLQTPRWHRDQYTDMIKK